MARRVTFRYQGVEGLACPRCGRQVARLTKPVADHHSPDGWAEVHRSVDIEGPERLFADDTEVTRMSGEGFSRQARIRYVHHYDVTCGRCMRLYHRSQCVRRTFRDDELPGGYWVPEVCKEGANQMALDMHGLGVESPDGGA